MWSTRIHSLHTVKGSIKQKLYHFAASCSGECCVTSVFKYCSRTAPRFGSRLKSTSLQLNQRLWYSSVAPNTLSLSNPTLRGYLNDTCDQYENINQELIEQLGKTTAEIKELTRKRIYLQPLALRMNEYSAKETELLELDKMSSGNLELFDINMLLVL